MSEEQDSQRTEPTPTTTADAQIASEDVTKSEKSVDSSNANESTDNSSKTAEERSKLASELIRSIVPDVVMQDPANPEPSQPEEEDPGVEVKFKLVYNKQTFEIVMGENRTVRFLKEHIEKLTKLPRSMQKLMYKGLVKDESKTLKELKIMKNAKMMLVGTTMTDLVAVNTKPAASEIAGVGTSSTPKKEPLCKRKEHIKVLEKGKPEDAMQGVAGLKQPLPMQPLNGMINKHGKVRLTFKLEEDSLWIGTKARTEKVPMSSIRGVVSEPIESDPNYHIMGIQLGPTELSRYWIYWVPAQYVDAIKDTILGKWPNFF